MEKTLINEGIANKLKEIAIDALSLDEEECTSLDVHVVDDLGAESIDFIDISFRLEKEFGLKKVKASEIFPFRYYGKELQKEELDDFRTDIANNFIHISPSLLSVVEESGATKCLFTLRVIHDYIVMKADN